MSTQAEKRKSDELLRIQEKRRAATKALPFVLPFVNPPLAQPELPRQSQATTREPSPPIEATSPKKQDSAGWLSYRDSAGFDHFTFLGAIAAAVEVIVLMGIVVPFVLLIGLIGIAIWAVLRFIFDDRNL